MVLGPSERIMSRSDSSKPRSSEVMPTTEVMPITTPSTVSAERSLLVRSVSSAMRNTSRTSPLFTAQCLDRVEPGGARGWIRAEEQADGGGDADTEDHRPRFEPCRQWREAGDELRGDKAEADADDAAERR